MNRVLDEKLMSYVDLLVNRYPELQVIRNDIVEAYFLLEDCIAGGGKILIAGNGGSASDAEHIVGELMKGFKLKRPLSAEYTDKLKDTDPVMGEILADELQQAIPAIALTGHNSLTTAYVNDVEAHSVYAQQLMGYGKTGDAFIGISTSGNSKNIIYATVVARASGIKVLGLTGESGGKLADVSDVIVKVPQKETYMIQELHLPIYHCWCLMLEDHFFGAI